MKTLKRAALLLVALLLLVPAGVTAEEIPADVKKDIDLMLKHMESLSEIAAANTTNCDAMGDAMIKYMETNSKEMQEVMARMESIPAEKQATIEAAYEERFQKAAESFIGGAMACFENAKVVQAMEMMAPAEDPSATQRPEASAIADVKLPADVEKNAEALIDHMVKLGEAAKVAGSDCKKMGVALNEYISKNGKEIKALVKEMDNLGPELDAALEARFAARMQEVMISLESIMMCADDPDVSKAMEAIFAPAAE